jgi:hypothetical protein
VSSISSLLAPILFDLLVFRVNAIDLTTSRVDRKTQGDSFMAVLSLQPIFKLRTGLLDVFDGGRVGLFVTTGV